MSKRSKGKLKRQATQQGHGARAGGTGVGAPVHQAGLLLLVLLVALVAVAVYLNAIPDGFVFDDKLIQRDPRIHLQTSFWTIFVTDYWYKYIGTSADLYRPLTIASYALNYAVAGLSSPAFHAVNILLHALLCGLLVVLLDALLRDRTLAVVSGLLFATHPIHTEAVTGIVGRAEILTALFLLAALYLHVRGYTLWGQGRAVWLPVALLAYFCALLSKETAIVGPGLLLVVDGAGRARCGEWPFEQGEGTGGVRREAGGGNQGEGTGGVRREAGRGNQGEGTGGVRREAGGRGGGPGSRDQRLATFAVLGLYVAVAALYVFVRFLVVGQFLQRPPARSYYLLFGQPLVTRLLTGMKIFAIYLRLLLYPLTLSADYSYRQVPLVHSLTTIGPLLGLLAAAGFAAACVWAWRQRQPAVLFALGFFAAAYSVVSNLIVPIGVLVAERLMYLPSIGFCVGLAWVGLSVTRRFATMPAGRWVHRAGVAVLVVMLVLYGARTFARNLDWHDQERLYAVTTETSPECHAAQFNYAAVLMNSSKRPDRNRLALKHLLKAYAIRQDHYPSLVNLSLVYLRLGELEKAREMVLQGLKVRPGSKKLKGIMRVVERQLRRQKQRVTRGKGKE